MWTSADSNRDEYQRALTELIKDNAGRLADASDIIIGGYNKAHLILEELIERAHNIVESK